MEVNKKQLADIFGASIRTIQNWQEQGMPVLRGGGKGNEVLYDSADVIKWYAERDAEIENEKLRREVEELRQAATAAVCSVLHRHIPTPGVSRAMKTRCWRWSISGNRWQHVRH